MREGEREGENEGRRKREGWTKGGKERMREGGGE